MGLLESDKLASSNVEKRLCCGQASNTNQPPSHLMQVWTGCVAGSHSGHSWSSSTVLCKSRQVSQVNRGTDPFTAGSVSTLFSSTKRSEPPALLGLFYETTTCTARKERARSRMTFVATREMAFMKCNSSARRGRRHHHLVISAC